MTARLALLLIVAACVTSVVGCLEEERAIDTQSAEAVPVRLDKSNPERLLRSLLGGYAAPGGDDPFEVGLLSGRAGDLMLHPQKIAADLRPALRDADGNGAIGWDELVTFLDSTYTLAREAPPTIEALRAEAPYAEGDSAWFAVEVSGVMTAARRRVFVPVVSLREAIGRFAEEGALTYPAGTVIVGEHVPRDNPGGEVMETTVKRRRADGFWDFFVYGPDGRLASSTTTDPRPLRTPTQCTGCHLGQKLYEPEQSFPAEAAPGPFGPRAYHVPEAWRNAEIASRFNEHAARPDGVLGLYATLYAARLQARRASGEMLAPADTRLLDALDL